MDSPPTSDDSVAEVLEDHIAELMIFGTTLTKRLHGLRCWDGPGLGGPSEHVGGRSIALLDTQRGLCSRFFLG